MFEPVASCNLFITFLHVIYVRIRIKVKTAIMEKTCTESYLKIYRRMVLLLVMFISISLNHLIAQPLNGTYTIGSSGTYTTFAAALADLATNGVSGPVTMQVLAGTYSQTASLIIGNYFGVNAGNPLVFDGVNAATAIITGSISNGATVILNNCRYVTLKNLTINNNALGTCSGVALVGSNTTNAGTGNSIKKCFVNLPNTGTTQATAITSTTNIAGYGLTTQTRMDSITIDSNTITGAYHGIYLYGVSTISNSYNRYFKIRGNTVNNFYYSGLYIMYIQNGFDLIGNTFTMATSPMFGYAVYSYYCYNHFTGNSPHRIINNKFVNSYYSLNMFYMSSTVNNPAEVYNNTIIGRSNSNNYGLYIFNATYTGYFNVYHNTVKCLDATTGYCFYYSNSMGGSLNCMNNIFVMNTTSSGYYAANFATTTGSFAINNNVYYMGGASSPNLLYRGAAYTSANYQTTTAGGDSSKNLIPNFVSPGNDGHLMNACNPKGSPTGSFMVPADRDGQTRPAYPHCGSDQHIALSNNLSAVALISPSTPITMGSQDLIVRVKNLGANTVDSFFTAYTLNGGTAVAQAHTTSLAVCDTVSIVFSGINQVNLGGTNDLKVYTYAPNSSTDSDPANDTITAVLNAPISGTYTIGSGGYYPTFQAAIDDLANGISGPVTFLVLAGTYNVPVVINGPIAGSSATNTITFDGGNGNKATRIISVSNASQAAVLINNCKYVGFRNLTITNTGTGPVGVGIIGNGTNNNGTGCFVNNCNINLPNAGTTMSFGISVTAMPSGLSLTNNFIDSISIDSNVISGGYYSIGISGHNLGNPNNNRNHKVRYNTLAPSYYSGIYILYVYHQLDLLNNAISFGPTSTIGIGINLFYCNNTSGIATRIHGNKIEGAATSGINLTYSTMGSGLELFNNVITQINNAFGYGIYLSAANLSGVKIIHNTVVMNAALGGVNYGALYGALPSNSIIKNNIFVCNAAGNGTPVYLTSGPVSANSINNNIYYNVANAGIIYRNSTLYNSGNFKTNNAGGDSSFNVNPQFISAANLQVTSCLTGYDYTSWVPVDINNVTRNVPPKIGAYENTTPLTYVSANTIQNTGQVAPGATDFVVLRIPVTLAGCGNGLTTNFYFNTTGTTNAANIVNAKIYNTGTSASFNLSKLVGTVTAPSGQFIFTVSDTIDRSAGDTVNYWLTYDVSASAPALNLLDARCDSIMILGSSHIPSNNNPAGNLIINTAMTYVGSNANHPVLITVQPSTTNNQMLRILIIGSSSGAPINVTQFNLNTTGGGNDALNIANAKIFYTGNNAIFATSNQFGSTYTTTTPANGSWAPYVISGLQPLLNDTNYFWLTYDIKAGAILGDSVDAEVSNITINSIVRTPTISAPAGFRKIRAAYCPSAATQTGDEEIWRVGFGTLNNISTCLTTGGPGSLLNRYSNYMSLAAPNISMGVPTPVSVNTGSCGGNYGSFLVVYIDYNQNGLLTDPGELAYSSGSFTSSTAGILKTGLITIPCTAIPGNALMRVIFAEVTTTPAPCGTYNWGETEDYTINIVNSPASYTASKGVQVTGFVAQGTNDVPIMRVPVKVLAPSCNPSTITELRFSTTGTTNVSDITTAKLYKTGAGSIFNTNTLLATVSSVSGQIVFSISDTVLNDSNNYWLAYNVSAGALNGNLLDAVIDSVKTFGSWYVPATNNPAGSRVVGNPMLYITSQAIHPDLSKVETGSVNNRMLRIFIRTTSTGSPINVTQFNLAATGGGNDTNNITNAKVWYTGTSPVFSTTTQFGITHTDTTTVSNSWSPYVITGAQPLNNDTNYFWLTYDIDSFAFVDDSVDAVLLSFVAGGNTETPTITAPAGNRIIRNPFCASAAYYNNYNDIGQVNMTQSSITILNNGTGCTPALNNSNAIKQYTDYSGLNPANMLQNIPVNFTTCMISGAGFSLASYLGIFIDFNQNGSFDFDEQVYASTNSSTTTINGSFTIPCTALPGNTRMRIVLQYNAAVSDPCLSASTSYYYGETEDYTINIISNPITFRSSTAIQQTGYTSPGATDVSILRIPIKALGCDTGSVTELRFNTAGTTTPSNITMARLYGTGTSSTFNTGNLLGQVSAPSGQMVFNISEQLSGIDGDTDNFWLAYNISPGASTTSNFVDGRLDSVKVFGQYYMPVIGNPAGNKQISIPMTYVSSVASHPELSKVEQGGVNSKLLKIVINTSATGAPAYATNFNLNTLGSASPYLNIDNANMWYTGNSSTFNTSTQFGSTSYAPSGAYSIPGSQPLLNGTNVFWLTYDIASGAVIDDSVDAVVSSVTIDGVPYVPTNGSPAGSRKIRAPYCTSSAVNATDEEIWNVSFGSLNNSSTCTTTGDGYSALRMYSDYRSLTPPDIAKGLATLFSVRAGSCNGNFGSFIGAYIDYNQNGSFTDTGELVYSSGAFTSSGLGLIKSGMITIPCNAALGITTLRVVYSETTTIPPPCGNYYWGETEDYSINIIQQAASYTGSGTIQITGSVAAGAINIPILRIPVKVISTLCLPGTTTQLNFNTTGTTNAANIVSAKLYTSGNSAIFNTSKLLGTVTAPSGSFSFTIADTTLNDSNNYWLAYDVSASASTGNFLDARIDSVKVFGAWRIPANGNPAGNRIISAPMTFISTTVTHPDLSALQTSSVNNRMLCIKVMTSSGGAPVNITSFSLGTQGSTAALADINNAKVWYTGSSNTFAASNQFGSTTTSPNGTFVVAGTQALTNDSNFFWLTYDISVSANVGDSADAQMNSLIFNGTTQTPAITAPAGKRVIRAPYCISQATQAGDEDIFNVSVAGFSNSSNCTTTGGAGSLMNRYSDYTYLSGPVVHVGDQVNISVTKGTCGGFYGERIGIYIDWNQNGILTDAGENVFTSTYATGSPSQVISTTITIPNGVVLGSTLMRVVYVEGSTVAPCGTYNWGETEDYTIVVDPPLPLATYIWTGAVSTNFVTAGNWTPARSISNINDKLLFNSGGSITVSNVPSSRVRTLELANSTLVKMSGTLNNMLLAGDSLVLGNSSRINTGNIGVGLGTSTVSIGALSGSGSIYGTLQRWINASNTTVNFPLADSNGITRNVNLNYTTMPGFPGSITASFVMSVPGTNGLPLTDAVAGVTANRAGVDGYWNLSSLMFGGTFTGTFNASGFLGVGNYQLLILMRRANSAGTWGLTGIHAATTGSNSAPVLSRTGMNTYGQFGVGGNNVINPLPVKLLYFKAFNANGDALLNWATATETNNSGFMIERSTNGELFYNLIFVEGKGNSKQTIQYAHRDPAVFSKTGSSVIYYRLKQIDRDGEISYSETIMVKEDDVLQETVNVYPNPFYNETGVAIESISAGTAQIQLYDMLGNKLIDEILMIQAGSNYSVLKDLSGLAHGVYFVKVNRNGISKTIKVTKID